MGVAHQANVADEASVAAMVAAAIERFGGLHIAVNNAGINANSAAEDTPMAEWDATFNVNTRGVFMCCQHEARHMLKHGGGKIINTASMASLIVPHPQKQAAYNASKSAVVKLTQSLALPLPSTDELGKKAGELTSTVQKAYDSPEGRSARDAVVKAAAQGGETGDE